MSTTVPWSRRKIWGKGGRHNREQKATVRVASEIKRVCPVSQRKHGTRPTKRNHERNHDRTTTAAHKQTPRAALTAHHQRTGARGTLPPHTHVGAGCKLVAQPRDGLQVRTGPRGLHCHGMRIPACIKRKGNQHRKGDSEGGRVNETVTTREHAAPTPTYSSRKSPGSTARCSWASSPAPVAV